jgi:hypothetical protein
MDSDQLFIPVSIYTGSLVQSYTFDYNDSFISCSADLIPSASSIIDVRTSQSLYDSIGNYVSCSADLFSGSLENVRFSFQMMYNFASFISCSAKILSGSLELHIGANMFDKDAIVSSSVLFVSGSLI